jgi:sulfoxide reductase catalytic subunit YedY
MLKNPARKFWSDKGVAEEKHYRDRRSFIRQMSAAGAGAIVAGQPMWGRAALTEEDRKYHIPEHALSDELYPAKKNDAYKVTRDFTDKDEVFTYNNFYEFSLRKDVHLHVGPYKPFPWQLEIAGLCNKPKVWDLDEMLKEFALEERAYRFRCVEAWAMTVPWSGFALSELLKKAEPTAAAKYVRFESFLRPKEARGQAGAAPGYEWPYYEGLHIEEAMNPLAFVATGIYGKQLPKQCGSPLRIVLPWKYGYKGPKAVVKIEFTDTKPTTFWNEAAPSEYGYFSNVNPEVPHPRWSQASERLIGTFDRVETQLYNGYQDEIGDLHTKLYDSGKAF